MGLNIQFDDKFDYEAIISQIQSDSSSNYLLCVDDILAVDESIDLIFTRCVTLKSPLFDLAVCWPLIFLVADTRLYTLPCRSVGW